MSVCRAPTGMSRQKNCAGLPRPATFALLCTEGDDAVAAAHPTPTTEDNTTKTRFGFIFAMCADVAMIARAGGSWREMLPDGRYSLVPNTCRRSPTSPPTNVPLMRMNCKSRPICSSIFREVALASHAPTVLAISFATSSRACSTA